jgi:hypothetical protein
MLVFPAVFFAAIRVQSSEDVHDLSVIFDG